MVRVRRWTGAGSMLRASEGLREGPSAGFWFWEGCCVFARAMSWRPAGAFGRGESAIEFGRDPPVSESRELVVRYAELSAEFWARVSELVDSPGVKSSGLFLIQAGDAWRWCLGL